ATCQGDQIVFTGMPFMLSPEAIGEITHLLSAKTKGEIDRFVSDFLGVPPALRKQLDSEEILIF
ncbi:MAG: hypothetical protein AAF206_18705, partial [Bacteroidota bacterium]